MGIQSTEKAELAVSPQFRKNIENQPEFTFKSDTRNVLNLIKHIEINEFGSHGGQVRIEDLIKRV
jgi:hypothetical protein